MILAWNNGRDYDENGTYFFRCDDLTEEQAEALLKIRDPDGCTIFVAARVSWRNGSAEFIEQSIQPYDFEWYGEDGNLDDPVLRPEHIRVLVSTPLVVVVRLLRAWFEHRGKRQLAKKIERAVSEARARPGVRP